VDPVLQHRCREASAAIAESFTWDKVARPLLNYCEKPYHLPEHIAVTMPSLIERFSSVYHRGGKKLIFAKAKQIMKEIMPS
jgi:hypothetical protein